MCLQKHNVYDIISENSDLDLLNPTDSESCPQARCSFYYQGTPFLGLSFTDTSIWRSSQVYRGKGESCLIQVLPVENHMLEILHVAHSQPYFYYLINQTYTKWLLSEEVNPKMFIFSPIFSTWIVPHANPNPGCVTICVNEKYIKHDTSRNLEAKFTLALFFLTAYENLVMTHEIIHFYLRFSKRPNLTITHLWQVQMWVQWK